jgi:hypothetical protein
MRPEPIPHIGRRGHAATADAMFLHRTTIQYRIATRLTSGILTSP